MRILKNCVREPVAVYLREVSGGSNTLRVSIRQRVYGEARAAIAALFGGIMRLKHVYVFDEDIDIHDDRQVDWAMGTRFQADEDLVVLQGMMGMTMDPSLNGRRTGAKSGFDCTRPFGRDGEIPLTALRAPKSSRARRAIRPSSRRSAPAPMFYADIVELLGSRDGREVACAHRRIAPGRPIKPRPRRPLSSRRRQARPDRHRRRALSRPERGDVT